MFVQAGHGVGIDVRCAQNLYLMSGWFHFFVAQQEPACNLRMEAQTVSFLYRHGQANQVPVYRCYVTGTIQMNIHHIHRRDGGIGLVCV